MESDKRLEEWRHLLRTDPEFRRAAASKMDPNDVKIVPVVNPSPETKAAIKELERLIALHSQR